MSRFFLPSFEGYKRRYVKSDLLAALVVTAIAVPESLGFAAIVGLPPQAGLYSALFAPIVFAIFAHTRRLVVGADSATAALVASGAGLVAAAGSPDYTNAIVLLGLLTAVLLILMGVSKLGFLADLISRPVLVGFLAGVGVQLILGKLPEMLGIEQSGNLLQKITGIIAHAGAINTMTVTISVLVVGLILILRHTRYPAELLALVAATILSSSFAVAAYGVKLVGALPAGLPTLTVPQFTPGLIMTLFPAALAIALVILAQSSAVIRSQAAEHDDKIRLNTDLISLGFANAVSALTRGFAINGSPPRSQAADMAGGKTQLVNVYMSILIGLLLLFGSTLFVHMPVAALASVVCMVGFHLIRVQELVYIWRAHRTEFFIAMIALVGVALLGVQQGVLIAVIVSLMERLSRQYRPKDDILLRDGKLSDWAQQRIDSHHRFRSSPDGLLVYSFDGSLFFENISYFVSRLKAAIRTAKEPVRQVIVDAGAIESIDYTAVEAMKQLHRHLGIDNITLGFAHVSPQLRTQFDEYGMTNLLGKEQIFPTLNAAIEAHPGATRSVVEMVKRLELNSDHYVVIGGGVMEVLGLRTTRDTDLVVNDDIYRFYRDEKGWKEYVQDNGKKILSHNGYNLMRSWMGRDLKALKKDAFQKDEVSFMSVKQLIECKHHLGRKKDFADIELLNLSHHRRER